jgi:hypothetical protein
MLIYCHLLCTEANLMHFSVSLNNFSSLVRLSLGEVVGTSKIRTSKGQNIKSIFRMIRTSKDQNVKNQNVKNQNVKNQNVENQNVKNQNVKNQNVKNQNVKNQNVKSLKMTFDVLIFFDAIGNIRTSKVF